MPKTNILYFAIIREQLRAMELIELRFGWQPYKITLSDRTICW